MATDLLDLAVPGLGPSVALLKSLYAKYNDLNEAKELCTRLHQRLEDFIDELKKIAPDTLQAEELLGRLLALIEEYLKTVSVFAEQHNFVRRVMKLGKFTEDIKVYNERLDSIIAMITVNQTDKLVQLLKWRTKYEEDAASVTSQLTEMLDLQTEMWKAMKRMPTTRDIQDLVLVVMRDVSAGSGQNDTPQPLNSVLRNIIQIAEDHFLGINVLETPPTWLIDADEVQTRDTPIDSGGMTCIYAGEWQGVQVAVKKFEQIDKSPVFDKHFNVWHTLLHPYVAQLYGAGSAHGAPFFVYEYADRQSLDRCWNQLSQKETWKMLHQAALGLLYLHDNHIVHGNLSSSKLLVTNQGNVKLFGFGASYFRGDSRGNSLQPVMREEFAAPECIGIDPNGTLCGSRDSPCFESDVYSFGLTIMEAIGKMDPFEGKQSKEILMLKRNNQLLQPREMSDEAWTLVKQMCVCDPSQRVPLADVAEQLRRFAQ
ncbi:Serine/threonine-protein kinase pim-3 [Phytophthora pseudosyringae]|uniref:Serine/threonine-protein kinase pim-3 n=1 Tax=Phytophthora pseudosyringae TaxID=221518 RepID=A0A8T1VNE0_9STRA|nr:Serine/threonine-protein kinase pim-3 [Phytophthora pseudosyringae]